MPPRNVCWLISALVITACGPDEREESPTPEDESLTSQGVSPTPDAATPAPTLAPATPLPPLDTWQRMTHLVINEGTESCPDINGDGLPDNGLPAALDTLATGILAAVSAQINAAEEDGVITESEAAFYQEIAAHIVASTASVEGLNTSLAYAIASGSGFYSYQMAESTDQYRMSFYKSDADPNGNTVTPLDWVGTLWGWENPREVCASYGPGKIDAGLIVTLPETSETQAQNFDLVFPIKDTLTEMCYDPIFSHGTILGGGIDLHELALGIDQVIDAALRQGATGKSTGVIMTIYDELLTVSDMTCSDGTACLSMCATFDGLTTQVVIP